MIISFSVCVHPCLIVDGSRQFHFYDIHIFSVSISDFFCSALSPWYCDMRIFSPKYKKFYYFSFDTFSYFPSLYSKPTYSKAFQEICKHFVWQSHFALLPDLFCSRSFIAVVIEFLLVVLGMYILIVTRQSVARFYSYKHFMNAKQNFWFNCVLYPLYSPSNIMGVRSNLFVHLGKKVPHNSPPPPNLKKIWLIEGRSSSSWMKTSLKCKNKQKVRV